MIILDFCCVKFSVLPVQMKLVQWNTWHYIVLLALLNLALSALFCSLRVVANNLLCFARFVLFCLFCSIFARSVFYWSFRIFAIVALCFTVPFYFARFTQFCLSFSIEFTPLSVAFVYCSVVFIPLFCSVAIVLFVSLRSFRFVLWQPVVLLVSLLVSVVNRLSDSKCRIHSPLLDMEWFLYGLNSLYESKVT